MHNAALQKLIHDSPVTAFFGAACLLCCALLLFAAAPQWLAYKERAERVRHYDKYISSSDGFDVIRQNLESKNELLRSKLGGISADMPPRSLPDILQELISRGNSKGITLTKIQPQSEGSSGRVPVLLETNTDYQKLGEYISSLETLPHILQIRKVAVETRRGGELNVKLLADCIVQEAGNEN